MTILILVGGVKTSKHGGKKVLWLFLSLKTAVFLLLSIEFGLVGSENIMTVFLVKFSPI